MDENVLQDEYIGCHPCVNTSSLKMRTEDVINTFLPAVGHDYKTVHLVGNDWEQVNVTLGIAVYDSERKTQKNVMNCVKE